MSHTHAVTPADTQVLGPDTVSGVAEVPEVPETETLDAVGPAGFPYDEAEPEDLPNESFIPRPRYRVGRSTKVLACILLVALGAFGGALTQKAVDGGSARSTRSSQFSTSGSGSGTNGAGTGTGTGQGRRSGQSGTSGPSSTPGTGAGTGSTGGAG